MSMTAEEFVLRMPPASELLSDEPQMETPLHYQQLALLVSCLEWHWRDRDDFFIGANLSVYYDVEELRQRRFTGPDLFVVREGVAQRPRNSWVIWQEAGRYPDLIVELLSKSTARVDKTDKKALYQNVFRTPEYFWFSPVNQEFQGFVLEQGRYRPITPAADGRLWSQVLELYLGVADGRLRYFDRDGRLLPSPHEAAEQEGRRAEQARQQAEQAQQQAEQARQQAEQAQQQAEQARQQTTQERQRAERLAEKLRALGIDPDQEP